MNPRQTGGSTDDEQPDSDIAGDDDAPYSHPDEVSGDPGTAHESDGDEPDMPPAGMVLDVVEEEDWKHASSSYALPKYNIDTKVVTCPETGRHIGSIKPVREGQPSEAMSVYCKLHQCQPPLRRCAKALPFYKYQLWFQYGLDLPSGKAGQSAHMKKWKELDQEQNG